ncbi:tyrosine-type recombinase/integrase [Pseudonocardia sp. 73-21]|uniref:tyrosine-type recombinase/integrase n=1 Tax=Pseudonocardia sp. 73-21 TaxID=1895809 RepID=UPI000962AB8F|nr:tyrosine-type recombinase/integrase [Pseudonocardia sp. 73-21]OJY43418.1 MAG: multidrug DMT transporter permease [Pseudonocardia sp. 73-21]
MAWVEQSGNNSWRVRYRRDDGTIGAINGFATKTAAGDHAGTLESDQRQGRWIDPAAGKTTVAEWTQDWLGALDVAIRTEDYYRSLLRRHILPRWGDHGLADISGIKAAVWAKQLRADGYAQATVSGVTKLLSLLLADAVEERLIVANPIRARRRGRHRATRRVERIWATPEEALAVADNAARLPGAGPGAAVLIVTAAWTGARWGELVGLQRCNTHLDDGVIVVDPDIGTLHESSRGLELGPPKTAESARTIALPAFLVGLLQAHLDGHDHRHVFVSPEGELHRRSNFGRRAMRPAADGNQARTRPEVRLAVVKTGLTFHGLRHSHKTWMIADGVPEIAQARRLGHILDDKIQQTYSHVAAEVDARLLEGLADRWAKAVADSPDNSAWRSPSGVAAS